MDNLEKEPLTKLFSYIAEDSTDIIRYLNMSQKKKILNHILTQNNEQLKNKLVQSLSNNFENGLDDYMRDKDLKQSLISLMIKPETLQCFNENPEKFEKQIQYVIEQAKIELESITKDQHTKVLQDFYYKKQNINK